MKTLSRICSGAFFVAALCLPSLSRASSIVVTVTDDRDISDFNCKVSVNGWSGPSDTEGNYTLEWGKQMQWSLYYTNGAVSLGYLASYGYDPNGRQLVIVRENDSCSNTWNDMYIKCDFTIWNAPHSDYEALGNWDGCQDIDLVLNAWNGSWDPNWQGGSWVGDFLHH